MATSRFSFPTTIHFGPGARHLAVGHLQDAGLARPLIVTDRGLAGSPLVRALAEELAEGKLGPAVFGGVWGNPVAAQVAEGVAAFRAHGADAIIGCGGGAALDVAKAVALMSAHDGDILDYAWDHPRPREIRRSPAHWIALPTTSGTGSEVGRSAVIAEDATHVKRIIFSPALLARAVFADPELTFSLPAPVTAATGMDALTHNVESYLSPAYHPLCDGVALEGARIVAAHLRRAVRDGDDLAARSGMMMGALMGGVAFQKDLGAVHSCAHALGAVADLHHGLANAIMIDHVMRFNLGAAEEKLRELGRVCGAGPEAEDFIDWLGRLKADIGIPAGLGAAGIGAGQIARLVDVSWADSCHRTNPRPCSREDFVALFEAALRP